MGGRFPRFVPVRYKILENMHSPLLQAPSSGANRRATPTEHRIAPLVPDQYWPQSLNTENIWIGV